MDDRVRRTVETYERVADTYADSHDDRSVVADIVERFLAAVADVDRGDRGTGGERPRVLDVGCGPGWESATFADAGLDPVPFDLTPSFLDQARERVPRAPPVRGDMRALPFADDTFDGLWACASLLHVPESAVRSTLAEFERVLADGGVVCCSLKTDGDGAGDTDTSPYDDDRRHFERYDPERARQLFETAGFSVRDATTGESEHDAWVVVTARPAEA